MTNNTLTPGTTIYAQWAVGPAQLGSGWVDPRLATDLKPWLITDVWAFGYYVQVEGGGRIGIHDGQFLLEMPRCGMQILHSDFDFAMASPGQDGKCKLDIGHDGNHDVRNR